MKELLTISQVSSLLKVRIWTLREWVSTKKIPFIKLGGLVRFDQNEIKKFVNEKRVEP